MSGREGLSRADALTIVDQPCGHEKWNVLNAAMGCIHKDHGPYPFALADHHSGVRLVDGVPTRYLPNGTAA